jgi:hypothetical protein
METEGQASEAQPSLSDDLLMHILALLELRDLALCGMVSHDWARVSRRDELWMPFGRLVNNRVPGLTWKQCVHDILASTVPLTRAADSGQRRLSLTLVDSLKGCGVDRWVRRAMQEHTEGVRYTSVAA